MNILKAIIPCLICFVSVAETYANGGYYIPPTSAALNDTASFQAMVDQLISASTNRTSTATNIFQTYKSSVTNETFVTTDILNLLTNSFATNFPAGAQLAVSNGRFLVMDKTGTNVILNVASVFSVSFGGRLQNALTTRTTTLTNGGSTVSGNTTADLLSTASISYDDGSRATADGKHTSFQIYGIWEVKLSQNLANFLSTANFTFSGAGGGNLRGQEMRLDGQISGKGSGKPAA